MGYAIRTVEGSAISGSRETVLVKGREVLCPEISKSRIVVERFNLKEGLVVLRVARQPGKTPVPARFLMMALVGDEQVVEVDPVPVMVLPSRKNGFERDRQSFIPFEKD